MWVDRTSDNVTLLAEAVFLPLMAQSGVPRPDRNRLAGSTIDGIVSHVAGNANTHVSTNLWRTTRRWIRLAIVQQGLTGDDADAAVKHVEEVIHTNSIALGGRIRAENPAGFAPAPNPDNDDDDDAPANAAAPAGYHPRLPKPALADRFRDAVWAVCHAVGIPAPASAAPPPPPPPPTSFPNRDLLGDLELVAIRHGYHRPGFVATPPAGLHPPVAANERFDALPAATRDSLDLLARRLFSALPHPFSRRGAAACPTKYLPTLHLFGEHRDAYRAFLVRVARPQPARHPCILSGGCELAGAHPGPVLSVLSMDHRSGRLRTQQTSQGVAVPPDHDGINANGDVGGNHPRKDVNPDRRLRQKARTRAAPSACTKRTHGYSGAGADPAHGCAAQGGRSKSVV